MSGHSHWATIKHKKGTADALKSRIFSKLTREISVAAREGKDPTINARLRAAIEKARSFNLPSENIERAIKRGAGEEEGTKLEEVLFEAYGPGGIAMLIVGITDNKNRTIGELKRILGNFQGKLVEGGAVQWLFEKRGVITLVPNIAKEEMELKAIDAGAEDFYWRGDGYLDVYTKLADLSQVKGNLQKAGAQVSSASIDWVPKEHIQVSPEIRKTAEKLFEALDENPDVQDIYSNLAL